MYGNILEAIKSYITEENTNYAILLDGDWGTGKTYFVENTLKKDAIINENCKVISISASGINDIDNFVNNIYLRIALEKLPSYKKRKKIYKSIIKGIGFLSNTLNNIPIDSFSKYGKIGKFIIDSIKKFILNKESDFSDILFVIDDIERISNSINIEDFLYKIYEFFISKGLKVIFVCNEIEMYSNDKEKQSKYFKIKEKVIRHTIDIYGIDSSIFKSIIEDIFKKIEKEEYKNNKYKFYKNYLSNIHEDKFLHINDLINIFIKLESVNIRTFLTYLDLSKKLFDIKEISDNKDFFEKILFELSLILIEIISSNEDKIEVFYKNVNNYQGDMIAYSDKIYSLNIFSYKKNIDYNLFNAIKNYIKTGYLDDNKVRNSYYEQIQSLERDNFWVYYKKLLNENNYKPDEIKEAIKVVFDKVEECLNNGNKIETKYTYEYIKDFNHLKRYIDLYNENNYIEEIEEYIELEKKIWDYYFDNLDLKQDIKIDKIVFDYDFYYHNKKYNKPTYKNNRMQEIDEYYESKLDNAYKKAKENMKNKLIEKFEDKKMDNYIYFNSSINRFIVFNFAIDYDFLKELEVNAYNIDIIIKLIHNNILDINNASDFFDGYNLRLKEIKKYLDDDKIKNGKYDNNTNKKIEELKSVFEKAKEHIKPNKKVL